MDTSFIPGVWSVLPRIADLLTCSEGDGLIAAHFLLGYFSLVRAKSKPCVAKLVVSGKTHRVRGVPGKKAVAKKAVKKSPAKKVAKKAPAKKSPAKKAPAKKAAVKKVAAKKVPAKKMVGENEAS